MKNIGMNMLILLSVAGMFLLGHQTAQAGENDPRYTPSGAIENAPFSEAVTVGRLVFLSGQIGTDATGRLVPGGIAAETRQTMENIRVAVERNGSSMDHIVKCTIFLADIGEWQAFNEVYVTFFKKSRLPARSALGASGLALNARTEVECIAAVVE
jgi:reactive intermediate/imine deaminase